MYAYDVNVLIGVELHVKKYDDAPSYHCHIIFNEYVTKEGIDEINAILDSNLFIILSDVQYSKLSISSL